MTWLVTGGAGYIGAHVVRAFREAGQTVAVLDSLTSGHPQFVPADVPFVRGSIVDGDLVPQHPPAVFARGGSLPVPLIIGTNRDEATLFTRMKSPLRAPTVSWQPVPQWGQIVSVSTRSQGRAL